MHAVVGKLHEGLVEKIDHQQLALASQFRDHLYVGCQIIIAFREVRNQWTAWFLEGCRSDQDDLPSLRANPIDQLLVALAERFQASWTGQGFKLAKLNKQDRGTDPFELIIMIAEAILSPAFNYAALAKDGVGLPGQVAKPGASLGKRVGQHGFELSTLLQVHHVGATQEGHDVLFLQGQGSLGVAPRWHAQEQDAKQ